MITLNCDDPKLQQHCEKVISVMTSLPEDLRPICALLDAWHWFRLAEGDGSHRVMEAVRQLSHPRMRSALKAWYLGQTKPDASTDNYRRTLEQTIGEQLPLGRV
jgi:hypothetical protein